MNLPDVVREVSVRCGIRQEDVSKIIKSTFTIISENVINGDTVAVPLFGKFAKSATKERVFRDPRTGESVTRKHTRFTFTPSQLIKSRLKDI